MCIRSNDGSQQPQVWSRLRLILGLILGLILAIDLQKSFVRHSEGPRHWAWLLRMWYKTFLGNYRWQIVLTVCLTITIGTYWPAHSFAQTGVTPSPTAQPTPTVSPKTTATADTVERYQGIPVGFTIEGYPFLGDPDAPLTFIEYSDYLCPFCGRHFNQTTPPLLERYGLSGQVRLVFRDFPIPSLHPTAPIGHQAARCVAEQGAVLFWTMHDELFRRQGQWNQLADPTAFLAELAETLRVDTAAYTQCMASGRTIALVDASIAAGQALGLNSTPSFQLVNQRNGKTYTLVGAMPVTTFTQYFDALLTGKEPPQEPEPEKPELPFWANAEGLAPDPKRPGFDMAGDPYKGDPAASLTVIEFSDFQCPACGKHVLETQPIVDETFVAQGELRWVHKQFPLRSHRQAPVAAAAAECAGKQGAFWPMHDLLYTAVEQWTIDQPEAELSKLATQLGLNPRTFATCLNSRQALEPVLSDLYDAIGVVQNTPTFIVLYAGQGTVIRGAQPTDQFVATLQKFIDQAHTDQLSSAP